MHPFNETPHYQHVRLQERICLPREVLLETRVVQPRVTGRCRTFILPYTRQSQKVLLPFHVISSPQRIFPFDPNPVRS